MPELPELPEVESARQVIERTALERRIVAADDTDAHECRPHAPGELQEALLGRRLRAAHRRGKSIWCETTGLRSRDGDGDGPPPGHERPDHGDRRQHRGGHCPRCGAQMQHATVGSRTTCSCPVEQT